MAVPEVEEIVIYYVVRHHYETLYINENMDQILDVLDKHIASLLTKISNHNINIGHMIFSCSNDCKFALAGNTLNWLRIFNFFEEHRAKVTFATKYVDTYLILILKTQ